MTSSRRGAAGAVAIACVATGCAALIDLGSLERVAGGDGGGTADADPPPLDGPRGDGPRPPPPPPPPPPPRPDGGIACGAATCPVATSKCCHDPNGSGGQCEQAAVPCSGGQQEMLCDGPEDCTGSGAVCCERRNNSGALISILCEPGAGSCVPVGAGSAQIVCNAARPACPTGTCRATAFGYMRCE